MTTYIKIELNGKPIDKEFETIDDAVFYVEKNYKADKNDILHIYVYDNEDIAIEHQVSTRNPYSGDFIYYSWGIYGENFYMDTGRVYESEILAEYINSEEEARERAETINGDFDIFDKFDRVIIANFSQTICEFVGYAPDRITIYERGESHE